MEPSPERRSFPWLFRWKFWRILLLLMATAFTLLALFHAEENWRGKRDLETYKREREAKGMVFDFEKFVPPRVPDDQNFAMTPFFSPLFNFKPGTQQPRDTNIWQRFQKIRLPNEAESVLKHHRWQDGESLDLPAMANELVATNRLAPSRFAAGQTEEAARAILEFIKPIEPVLDELRGASHRPASRFNIDYEWEPKFGILLPHLSPIGGLCSTLEARACAELALGQTDASARDIELMWHLEESIRNEPIMISQLVRATCAMELLQPIWEGVSRHQWSDSQLADFGKELQSLDFLDAGIRALHGEEGFCDSFFVELASHNPIRLINQVQSVETGSRDENLGLILHWLMPRGWFYLEQLNYHRLYADEVDDVLTPTGIDPDAADQKDDIGKELGSRGIASAVLHHRALSRILLPSVSGFEFKMTRAQTCANLASIAFALERYRLAHGRYPETLEALVPQFLAAIPHDLILDQPLKYRRTDDSHFIVYSVGWNKKDDGGVAVRESRERTDGDWVWKE